jgi:uncharacterized membrane protein YjjP (DUF1212 family)
MPPSDYSLTSLYSVPGDPGPATEDGTVRFLQLAARAFAAVDEAPARIEGGIAQLAAQFGFHADCTATATAVFLTVSRGDRQWTEVIRVHPSGPDFAKAVALHRLLRRVSDGELSPDDGAERLARLLEWRGTGSALATIVASALLSVSAGLLLRAEGAELALAVGLGAAVGLALVAVSTREHLEPLAPVVLAAVAAFVAFSAKSWHLDTVRPMPLLIASLVIFLPGWRLTVAMTELAQGHWTSGAGRFLAAITTLLLLIVGVVAGQEAARSSEDLALQSSVTLPATARVVSPLLAGLAMTHLFRARRRDAWWITAMCVLTSLASFLSGRWLGPTASAFVGAFTAMAVGALVARRLDLPYPVLQQPATVLLVPGSIGFVSMSSLLDRNVSGAIQTGFQMLFVALTLALGAMTAQVALRPLTSAPQRSARRERP